MIFDTDVNQIRTSKNAREQAPLRFYDTTPPIHRVPIIPRFAQNSYVVSRKNGQFSLENLDPMASVLTFQLLLDHLEDPDWHEALEKQGSSSLELMDNA